MKEEPTAGPSGSAAVPGLERVKLDMSEAVAEEAVRRDDELGLVDTALDRTLRPVLRRCDEVLSRPDSVRLSAITAGQRRRLGRSVGRPAVWPLSMSICVSIVISPPVETLDLSPVGTCTCSVIQPADGQMFCHLVSVSKSEVRCHSALYLVSFLHMALWVAGLSAKTSHRVSRSSPTSSNWRWRSTSWRMTPSGRYRRLMSAKRPPTLTPVGRTRPALTTSAPGSAATSAARGEKLRENGLQSATRKVTKR